MTKEERDSEEEDVITPKRKRGATAKRKKDVADDDEVDRVHADEEIPNNENKDDKSQSIQNEKVKSKDADSKNKKVIIFSIFERDTEIESSAYLASLCIYFINFYKLQD